MCDMEWPYHEVTETQVSGLPTHTSLPHSLIPNFVVITFYLFFLKRFSQIV